MASAPITPRAVIAGVPIHAMIVPFPIVCFTGAMITDIVYSRTADIQWANFSAWLLAFGMLMGSLAALFGMIDFFRSGPKPAIGWAHLVGNLAILSIALLNNFVHARDGWTSVVPTGLILSVVTVLMMIVTGFLGHLLVYRHVVSDVIVHREPRGGDGL